MCASLAVLSTVDIGPTATWHRYFPIINPGIHRMMKKSMEKKAKDTFMYHIISFIPQDLSG